MTANKLGKGLSSLLGERLNNYNNNAANLNLVKEIPLESIVANRYQPRKIFRIADIENLASSIKSHGLLQPIIVRKHNDAGKYEIIAGERRFRASKLAGLKTISVIVKEFDNKKTLTLAIIENIHREDLSPIEEAEAYKQLIDEFDFTHNHISDTVGKSRSHIANLIRLLNLPLEIQDKLNNKILEMGHARALINSEHAIEICNIVVKNNLTVRETEELVKNYKEKQIEEQTKKQNKFKPDYLSRFEKVFSDIFGLKSKASFNHKTQKGKIIINYTDIADLEKIINKLV
jgi:ParB family transcriptional regulator, chromosome partitioning protein